MVMRSITCQMLVFLVAITCAVASSGNCLASNLFPVEAGYDLFKTVAGATFDGIKFEGLPLGVFDFGSGNVNTGSTDTIVQRTQAVIAAGGTTNLSMKALQLKSIDPVMGHTLFVTLNQVAQQLWESDLNHNLMTIGATTFDTSMFRAYFDVHVDSLNGMVIDSQYADLTSVNNPWVNEPPDSALLITGVNHLLNGVNESGDFWPVGVIHNGPHPVTPAVPEPGGFCLAAMGLVSLAFFLRMQNRNCFAE